MRSALCIILLFVCCSVNAQKAPDFTITDTNGKTWNLYEELAKGRTVLIDFFFADCTPCQTYTPMVEQLFRDYGAGADNVLVIGISDRDDNPKMKQFDQTYGVTYPTAGVEGGGDDVTALFMNWFTFTSWPTYAVICPDTSISWNVPKSKDLPEIRAAIDACPEINGIEVEAGGLWNINIYPVPVSDFIFIDNLPPGMYYINLTDMTGRAVFNTSRHGISSSIRIELPKLTPGIYTIRISAPSGQHNRLITIKE